MANFTNFYYSQNKDNAIPPRGRSSLISRLHLFIYYYYLLGPSSPLRANACQPAALWPQDSFLDRNYTFKPVATRILLDDELTWIPYTTLPYRIP